MGKLKLKKPAPAQVKKDIAAKIKRK